MNMKNYILILLVALVFISVCGSVSALSIDKISKSNVVTYFNGKSTVPVYVYPDSESLSKSKKELDSVRKIVVTLNGKRVNTIKKGKDGVSQVLSFLSC